jgi:hypothetical protein
MATSVRQAVLAAMLARLQAIAAGAGFQTDAGAAVFLGEAPTLGPEDPDTAIAVLVGDDKVTFQSVGVQIRLPMQICALAKVAEGLAGVAAGRGDARGHHAGHRTRRSLAGRRAEDADRGRHDAHAAAGARVIGRRSSDRGCR